MREFLCTAIQFLDKWQTLIGALVGGIIALIAALIVARDARRREERAAAMLLTVDLVSVLASNEALDERIKKHEVKAEDVPQWITDRLMNSRAKLSPMFEASMLRVMPVDVYLAAHLSLFKTIYSGVLEMVERLVKANEVIKETGKKTLTDEEIASHIRLIHSRFRKACEHAACAHNLLDRCITRRSAALYKLATALRIVKREKVCLELLKKG